MQAGIDQQVTFPKRTSNKDSIGSRIEPFQLNSPDHMQRRLLGDRLRNIDGPQPTWSSGQRLQRNPTAGPLDVDLNGQASEVRDRGRRRPSSRRTNTNVRVRVTRSSSAKTDFSRRLVGLAGNFHRVNLPDRQLFQHVHRNADPDFQFVQLHHSHDGCPRCDCRALIDIAVGHLPSKRRFERRVFELQGNFIGRGLKLRDDRLLGVDLLDPRANDQFVILHLGSFQLGPQRSSRKSAWSNSSFEMESRARNCSTRLNCCSARARSGTDLLDA